MATTKQVSDLIVKLMRVNTSHAMVSDLTELQRHFRGIENDFKMAEQKVLQMSVDNAKLKKEVEVLKKKIAEAAAPAPTVAPQQPGEPKRVAVGFEWKTTK
ncbi:MAG TPA: hypothetical protein VFB36_07065 [Nevskiaceae bacterium]|nr:hypothetical protein [Nevskiaceae bacterium]